MKGFTALLIIFFVGIFALYSYQYKNSAEEITITVIDKERSTRGSGEDIQGVYLIYTKNHGVF
jgi:hypothetical protein